MHVFLFVVCENVTSIRTEIVLLTTADRNMVEAKLDRAHEILSLIGVIVSAKK